MLAGSPEDIAGMKASRGIPVVRGDRYVDAIEDWNNGELDCIVFNV